MKQLGWVWATALYQAVQGQGQNQNTTVLNPRLYYFEEWFNSYTIVGLECPEYGATVSPDSGHIYLTYYLMMLDC